MFPADIPDIVAVSLVPDTVANPDKSVVHGFTSAAVADPLSVMFVPTHKLVVPVISGRALTVNVSLTIHPLMSLYVIVAEPAATPTTKPVVLPTLAIAEFEEIHASA